MKGDQLMSWVAVAFVSWQGIKSERNRFVLLGMVAAVGIWVRDPTTWTILQKDGPNHLE